MSPELPRLPNDLLRSIFELALFQQIERNTSSAARLLLVSANAYAWLVKSLYRVVVVTPQNVSSFGKLLEIPSSSARHIRHIVVNQSAYTRCTPAADLELDTLVALNVVAWSLIQTWKLKPQRLFLLSFPFGALIPLSDRTAGLDWLASNLTHLRLSHPFNSDPGPALEFTKTLASRLPSLRYVFIDPTFIPSQISSNNLRLLVSVLLRDFDLTSIALPLSVPITSKRHTLLSTRELLADIDDARVVLDPALKSGQHSSELAEDYARVVWSGGDPWHVRH